MKKWNLKNKLLVALVPTVMILASGEEVRANVIDFTYSGVITTYDVATSGIYDITAFGAQGGNGYGPGGNGAEIGGNLSLTSGETLQILVGGMGGEIAPGTGWGGGGGGSFVALGSSLSTSSPLVVAGGGGGGGSTTDPTGTISGGPGFISPSGNGSGGGYYSGTTGMGGGGGGFYGNGVNGTYGGSGGGGYSFRNGGAGGAGGTGDPNFTAPGGFGGGGGDGGGGGGYTGGAGGAEPVGGNGFGGSSFFLGTPSVAISGENTGNGLITLSLVSLTSSPSATPEPSTWLLFGTGMALMGMVGLRNRKDLLGKA